MCQKGMIKFFAYIVCCAMCFSCIKSDGGVRQKIRNYALSDVERWKNTEAGLTFSNFINPVSKRHLLIILNEKGDTLLEYLGKNQRAFRNFYKKSGAYVLEINNAYLDEKFQELGSAQPSGDAYFIDSLYLFRADTMARKLTRIPRIGNRQLIDIALGKYHLTGSFEMVHPPVSNWMTIAKDTLDGKQVFYRVNTLYSLSDTTHGLKISTALTGIYKMGLYEKGVTFYEDKIGCMNEWAGSTGNCFFVKSFYRFTDVLSANGFEQMERAQLLWHRDGPDGERVLLELDRKDFPALDSPEEIQANGYTVSDLRVDLFEADGAFFITTFLPEAGEFMYRVPPVYQILVPSGSAKIVMPLQHERNQEIGRISIRSVERRQRAIDFAEGQRIVKTATGYRIK